MMSLWITIPATLLLAGTLVALVVHAARRGEYDDWEGPAARMSFDDDSVPEVEGALPAHSPEASATPGADLPIRQ
ncbi:MAG TPA: cbb3-type cytochrome oxidase assembly protein [Myxococcota bacterium]